MILVRKNLWKVVLTVAAGMALVFAKLAVSQPSYLTLIYLGSIGALLIVVGLHRRRSANFSPRLSCHKYSTIKESIIIDNNERSQLILAPTRPIACPKLFLQGTGKQLIVENILIAGHPILDRPKNASEWKNGVAYQGFVLDEKRALRVVVHNQGPEKAMIVARIVGKKEEE